MSTTTDAGARAADASEADLMKALHERQLMALSDVLKNRIAPGSSKKAPAGSKKTAATSAHGLASVVAASPRPSLLADAENVEPSSKSLFTPSRLRMKRNKTKDVSASGSVAAALFVQPMVQHRETKSWQEATLTMDLAGMSLAEKARQESIYELIRSETDFVALLETIEHNYYVPIQRTRMLTITEYDTLFSNFADILSTHRKFLQELENRQNESFFIETISDALAVFANDSQVHLVYGGNQTRMEADLRRHLQLNKEFIAFINALNEQSMSRRILFNIRDDLTKPIARLNVYPQLFKDILSHTEENSAEAAQLASVIEAFENLQKKIIEKRKELEHIDRINELQTSIDFSIVGNKPISLTRHQRGKVVREGRVFLLTLGKELRARSRKDVFLIVIDDTLYILSDNHDGKKAYKLMYQPVLLTNITTMDVPDLDFERSNMFELRMTEPLELLVLQSPNSDDKQSWMRLFGTKHIPIAPAPLPLKSVSATVRTLERRASANSTTEEIESESSGRFASLQRRPSQTYVKDKRDIFENFLEMTGLRKGVDQGKPPVAVMQPKPVAIQPGDWTEQMLAVAENERIILRTTVSVQSFVPQSGSWTKLGVGEMVLVFNRSNRKTRLSFCREEDKDKPRATAAVSAWLQPSPMVNEKVTEQGNNKIKLVLIVAPSLALSTFVIRFKTTQDRDTTWDAIDKFKYADGEKPMEDQAKTVSVPASPSMSMRSHASTPASTPAVQLPNIAVSRATSRQSIHANPQYSSSASSVTSGNKGHSDAVEEHEQEDDDDENDSDDDGSEGDGEADHELDGADENDGAEDVQTPTTHTGAKEDEFAKLQGLYSVAQKEIDSLRAELLEKQTSLSQLLEKRAYEQRKVQAFMAKTKAKQDMLRDEKAALAAENEALKQQLSALSSRLI